MEANQLPHPRKGKCVSVVLITLTKESTNNKYNIIYCLFNARPLGGTTTPLKTSKRIKVSALCNQCSCYAEIPENSENKPWGLCFSKAVFEGLIYGGKFAFQNQLG